MARVVTIYASYNFKSDVTIPDGVSDDEAPDWAEKWAEENSSDVVDQAVKDWTGTFEVYDDDEVEAAP